MEHKIDIERLDRERDAIAARLIEVARAGPAEAPMYRGPQTAVQRARRVIRDRMTRERDAAEARALRLESVEDLAMSEQMRLIRAAKAAKAEAESEK